MKKTVLALAVLGAVAVAAPDPAAARASVFLGLPGFSLFPGPPAYYAPPTYYAPPAYYAPPPVYYAPPPFVGRPYAPAYYRRPYYRPYWGPRRGRWPRHWRW
jgi:hypothetical protein